MHVLGIHAISYKWTSVQSTRSPNQWNQGMLDLTHLIQFQWFRWVQKRTTRGKMIAWKNRESAWIHRDSAWKTIFKREKHNPKNPCITLMIMASTWVLGGSNSKWLNTIYWSQAFVAKIGIAGNPGVRPSLYSHDNQYRWSLGKSCSKSRACGAFGQSATTGTVRTISSQDRLINFGKLRDANHEIQSTYIDQ